MRLRQSLRLLTNNWHLQDYWLVFYNQPICVCVVFTWWRGRRGGQLWWCWAWAAGPGAPGASLWAAGHTATLPSWSVDGCSRWVLPVIHTCHTPTHTDTWTCEWTCSFILYRILRWTLHITNDFVPALWTWFAQVQLWETLSTNWVPHRIYH